MGMPGSLGKLLVNGQEIEGVTSISVLLGDTAIPLRLSKIDPPEAYEVYAELPVELRSHRLAEQLWIAGECFERSLMALTEYHGMVRR